MANKKSLLIEANLGAELKALLDYFRANPPSPHQPPRPHVDTNNRPPMVGILLADLVSGGKVDCAVLAEFATSTIQKVEQLGQVVSGTFTLGWAPQGQGVQTTPALPWNISAADLQTALEKLSTIGKGNVQVSLGNQTYTNNLTQAQTAENPGLWIVSFIGKFADQANLPLLTVTSSLSGVGATAVISALTYWGDTGRVETVKAAIPVGTPTPLRAGATFLAHFVPGSGYVLGSVEPRQFGAPY